jgi:DNA mismatch endonuclease Vsr
MDRLSKETRREIMKRIRAKNTKPELIVRRILHKSGFRYRLHEKKLPGKPDIVFVANRKVIFVHGCFGIYMLIVRERGFRQVAAIIGCRSLNATPVEMLSI